MEIWLANAAHIKAIPRRKTDVRDAEWIAQLVEGGRIRPSLSAAPGHPPVADADPLPGCS